MNSLSEKDTAFVKSVWDKINNKMSKVAVRSYDKIPYTAVDGVHDDRKVKAIDWWTNGFWGGMMWVMYAATGDENYRNVAEHQESLMDEALNHYDLLHHDVGFMWHILSGANYKITGNKQARNKNLFVASVLASRFNIDGRYIRSWNSDEAIGYSIIDCLMNIPLLYWASEEIGDARFKRIAMAHMDMSLKHHIRPDGSTNHIVNHNPETGEIMEILAGQGYKADSCWSRGIAWAIYGSILSYIHTNKTEYLDCAKKTTDYFIKEIEKTDYIPLLDFGQPTENLYYDSTAGTIAACGLIEISKYVSEEDAEGYMQAALNIIKALDAKCCDYNDSTDPLVLMGSERYPHTEASMKTVHMPIIYGDYFYIEALYKLKSEKYKDILFW